ncbi:MAG: hypothetical protein IPH45_16605 [Bacteroidales bacterium]|nr:hypothetical protein [Bacteroidales bacterium]
MTDSKDNTLREKEVVEKEDETDDDEMTEIQKFIHRKQLQNQILRKIADNIEQTSNRLKKTKDAS